MNEQRVVKEGKRWREWLSSVTDRAALLGGAAILVLMVLMTFDTLLRYFFNSPILWAFDVDLFLLVAIVYFGLAYTQSQQGHIRVDMVVSAVPTRAKLILEIGTRLAMLGLCALFAWAGWDGFWGALVRHEGTPGTIPLPLWPPKLLIPLAFLLMCLVLGKQIGDYVAMTMGKRGKPEPPKDGAEPMIQI